MPTNLFSHVDADSMPAYGAPVVRRIVNVPSGGANTLGTVVIRKNSMGGVVNEPKYAEAFMSSCLITSIRHGKEVAFRAEPTISGDLYVNFFGDKPTEYTVSGMAFDGLKCKNITNPHPEPLNSIYDFYEEYKLKIDENISNDVQNAITLTTYNTLHEGKSKSYVGLLIRMDVTTRMADASGIVQYDFNLTFLALN